MLFFSIKRFFSLITSFLPLFLFAQGQNEDKGIKWVENLAWDQIMAKAKDQNKYIFVDCYATWCQPCHRMDNEVYNQDSVGLFMSKNFICVQLQMDKTKNDNEIVKRKYNQAESFRNNYNIINLPTFLFLSPTSEIVHKDIGYKNVQEFLFMASQTLKPEGQYYLAVEQYKKGIKDYADMIRVLRMAEKLGDTSFANILEKDYMEYLHKVKQDDLLKKKNVEFISERIQNSKSRFLKLFYPHGEKVNALMRMPGFARRITDSVIAREFINNELKRCAVEGVDPNWEKMEKNISEKFSKSYAIRNVLWAKVNWNDKVKKNASDFTKYFVEFVQRDGMDTTYTVSDGWLNFMAYEIFERSWNRHYLNSAAKWMAGVVNRNRNQHYIDTYAQLLHKLGRKAEAIYWMQQIEAIGKNNNSKKLISTSEYYINKMKEDIPTWPTQDFSGIWVINNVKGLANNDISSSMLPKVMIVSKEGKVLKVERKNYDEARQIVSTSESVEVGVPYEEITKTKRKRVASIAWNSDLSCLTETIIYNNATDTTIDYTHIDTWTLNDEGRLELKRKRVLKDGKSESWKAIYFKVN